MEIIQLQDREKWNQTVKSFSEWDIYYLNEYAASLQIHGDGTPLLVYHQEGKGRLCYVMMQRDIADIPQLSCLVEPGQYLDWTTPYGYGGPLVEGEVSENWIQGFQRELFQWCTEHGVVCQFFRFHPLLQNQKPLEGISNVVYLKKTVYIDTTDPEIIMQNMTPNNRNMVRKAKKNGIKIVTDRGERIEEFRKIYEATMKENEAEQYYYFEKEYFDYLIREFGEHTIFFYAFYEEIPVSASIFFYNNNYMHYHLSGTDPRYRKLAAANLLLSEAANWAAEHGIKKLHLGGGLGQDDSLLAFKKHFNRNGLIDFYIGSNIFDQMVFGKLVELRKKHDEKFDVSQSFLIQYRR